MGGRWSLIRSATTEALRSAGCAEEESASTGTAAGCIPSAQSDNCVKIGGQDTGTEAEKSDDEL